MGIPKMKKDHKTTLDNSFIRDVSVCSLWLHKFNLKFNILNYVVEHIAYEATQKLKKNVLILFLFK